MIGVQILFGNYGVFCMRQQIYVQKPSALSYIEIAFAIANPNDGVFDVYYPVRNGMNRSAFNANILRVITNSKNFGMGR